MTENENVEKAAPEEPRIMCWVSKKMVKKSETVEVEYAPGKTVWVLPKYIRFED
ncbi:MAG: hypothetical protein RBU37_08750 [Myxococcota bacterium]|jgi:hypothetical protein|nr:hypothetical protein [Myxococcota bacterium]